MSVAGVEWQGYSAQLSSPPLQQNITFEGFDEITVLVLDEVDKGQYNST